MTNPHTQQQEVLNSPAQFRAVNKGRRWGGTTLLRLDAERQFKDSYGGQILYVAPNYSMVQFALNEMKPIIETEAFFYALKADEYTLMKEPSFSVDLLLIDEPSYMPEHIWPVLHRLVRPQIGRVLAVGTPKVLRYGTEPDLLRALFTLDDWTRWHFPTSGSPFVLESELAHIKDQFSEVHWRSQIMAEFVDVEGGNPS